MFKNFKKYYKLNSINFFCIVVLIILLLNKFYFAGLLFCIIYFTILNLKIIKKDKLNDQENKKIALEVKNSIENNILDSVYPAAIIDCEGKLIWFNSVFKNLYPNQELKQNKIISVVRGINIDEVLKCERSYLQRIEINKTMYEVYGKAIKTESNESFCLVNFADITFSKEDTKQCVMIIEIDNLKEIEEYIDEDKRPILVAEIRKTIKNYGLSLGAMVERCDNRKYILSVLESNINKEMNKKFAILDYMRDISIDKSMEVTLSIGVGMGGITPRENQIYAQKALELALGRGGDQAIIKTKDDNFIFGGNKKELEKRTKVRARVIAHALRDLIYESNNIFIMGHKNPDMDCFGASLGIAAAARQLGKESKIVLDNDTRSIDFFLKDVKLKEEYKNLIINSKDAIKQINEKTLLIITDVHSMGYVANVDLLKSCDRVVIIDHHRRSTDYIKNALLNYIEIYASSTSELVTEMIQYMIEKPKLNFLEAQGLLAGIFMDTKNFAFKTGVRTFEAAAFLKKLGADTLEIKKLFSNDLESYVAKAEIIKAAEVNNGIAISVCPSNVSEISFAAQGADELLNIIGIECSFVFVKIGKDIYLSSRSLGEVNVQMIMESLGGGGHRTMAGTKFSDTSLEEAKNRLKIALEEHLGKGEK